ncbi:uncharacterized protein BDR25DRAFT_320661 [Lindgomyces ingoldianus]|uniref:Uncharacterized protein n=1 Tax=Lindgomyces ingoldianus TaxID=673940 RepID=A0ACB6Q831_9PLEO|nr:uncharacterized protein BDR25DRAFT_320661 [Lindgomyces ingoldianus]KAF2462537.1 hypothetical protein BDR25DRAFT_320661 [Lindgomyces ingoldianus]
MRSIVLVGRNHFNVIIAHTAQDSNAKEPLLGHVRARMREDKFILSARAFLSLLAVAEAEDLDYAEQKLLPRELTFHRGEPATPARATPQAAPDERSSPEGAQLSGVLFTVGEQSSSANTEMLDLSKDTTVTLTIGCSLS